MKSRFAALLLCASALAAAEWKPAENSLTTPWTDKVSPANVLPEYPRPQMQRVRWTNLNGLWDYAIRAREESQPERFDGQILVPFAVESALSGVKRPLAPGQRLWYRRSFTIPRPKNGRLLLHFGAVDWRAEVWLNGKPLGKHEGGYDPFTFDITSVLKASGPQELVVAVWDPTSQGVQPRGKQVLNPSGIFYTAVSGIWQTVWVEAVPRLYIDSLKLIPDLDGRKLRITVNSNAAAEFTAQATLAGKPVGQVKGKANQEAELALGDVMAWSPDHPTLYDLTITLQGGDSVNSYFGMRKIEVRKGPEGYAHIFLNNAPVFMIGPLDQGWWPDGLYTAPTDEAIRFDIETTRRLGFTMARKHVKVEPARWYYWADKLGLMVWQDMPSPWGKGKITAKEGRDGVFGPEEAAIYDRELKAELAWLASAPSIIAWVPFNEGWGQHDTNAILKMVKETDPSRLVDGPSGWFDFGYGDMKDKHQYPGPGMLPVMSDRASVLGEFGGLGMPVDGHLWWNKKNWGYRQFTDLAQLQAAYEDLMAKLKPLVEAGLSAAVYTQTSDVEGEVNGLMTYDRKLVKFNAQRLAGLHRGLIEAGMGQAARAAGK